jgi:anti-anti-sigma factor
VASEGSVGNGEHQPELSVEHPQPGFCVIKVSCDIDMLTVPTLTQLLNQEIDADYQALVVDLSECDFIGSSGLAALVQGQDQAKLSGIAFALVGPNRSIQRTLEATALAPLFTTYSTLDSALTELSGS